MLTSFKVNGMELNAPNSQNGIWMEYPLSGLDAPTYRVSTYDRAGQDGSQLTTPFFSGRAVTIQGKIQSISPTTYTQARRSLLAMFGVNRDTNGNIIRQIYQFTDIAGQTYFMTGQAKTPVFGIAQMGWTAWKTDILVPDPWIYLLPSGQAAYTVQSGDILSAIAAAAGLTTSQVLQLNPQITNANVITPGEVINLAVPLSTGFFQPPQGGGFPVPTNVVTVSTLIGTNSVTATNTGNITVPCLVTLTGPLTTPYIVNNTLGLSMQINYTLGSGDIVIIDMLNKTIMLNGNTSLLGDKVVTSDWWGMAPGGNNISLSSGNSADTGGASVTWYSGVSGI